MRNERITDLINIIGTDTSGRWMSINNATELARMSYNEGCVNQDCKYLDFNSWFNEIENYGTRMERFHDEFQALDHIKQKRMIEWLEAAWQCARMKNE